MTMCRVLLCVWVLVLCWCSTPLCVTAAAAGVESVERGTVSRRRRCGCGAGSAARGAKCRGCGEVRRGCVGQCEGGTYESFTERGSVSKVAASAQEAVRNLRHGGRKSRSGNAVGKRGGQFVSESTRSQGRGGECC
ncbi:hypothetical protein DQ04_09691010 [Trypanosoma grayi]|uniref:hypothetical protein n=1 Tax=Trypanosoma grayi TaxID=71804 RepID=UPI0004F45360|nr:hypothetical protein DQ04_09691010 [Trypanosoma grayi]KEG07473.1 hypothetical protein DQ04_09691010 [Trypanosoma grayi]